MYDLLSVCRLPYNLYCVGGDVKHCSLTHSLNPPPRVISTELPLSGFKVILVYISMAINAALLSNCRRFDLLDVQCTPLMRGPSAKAASL